MVRNASVEEMVLAIRQRASAAGAGDADSTIPPFDAGFQAWLAKAGAQPDRLPNPPGLIGYLPLDAGVHGIEYPKIDPKEKKEKKDKKAKAGASAEARADLHVRERRDAEAARQFGGDKDRLPKTIPGKVGNAQTLLGDGYINIGEQPFAYFDRHQPFSFGLWFRIERRGASGPFVTRSGGIMNGQRGYEVMLRADGTFTAGLHHVAPDNSLEIETTKPVTMQGVASPGADLRWIEPRRGPPRVPRRAARGHARPHRSPAAKPDLRPHERQLGRPAAAAHRQAPGRDAAGRVGRRVPDLRSSAHAVRGRVPRRRGDRSARRRARDAVRIAHAGAAGGAPRALCAARGTRVREAVRRADLAARAGE